ncbi:hypothetical protein [Salipiger mucosus]|uniref:Uncharacterized protein n=1 Tax=Salipiger mucosus DSM 16094 TaxID=1123237 RepID=S9QVE3_9RHOB|nr:hypothetical protein [Salipiger mucosus]EPX83563.1 hypothetical protein Salmuc_02171 [Salipiger mucosus DSM 16094]
MVGAGYGAVEIVETDGTSHMSVLLDMDAITHIEKHELAAHPAPGP